jgi:HK97 family phage major capsid protein
VKEYIQREVEARARLEGEARAILDTAAEESRDLSAEENERWDALIAESGRRKDRITKLEQMEAAAEVNASVRDYISGATQLAEPPEPNVDDQIAEAVRSAWSAINGRGTVPGEVTFQIDNMAKVPYANEMRTLESMPGITGQQSEFSRQVGVYARTLSPWIGIARVINGTEGSPLLLPRLTTDLTTYTPGQGTAITASSPVITNATATPSSFKALSYITQEAAQDEQIGLLDLIASDAGRSIGLSFGSTTTTAVLAGFTNGGTASGTPFFDLNDLIDLVYGKAVPYRAMGAFVMATGAVQKARKFVDSNGQYLWEPSNQAGQPDRLLGFPLWEDPSLATPASATKSVLFGDPTEYVIKQLPLRVAVSTEYAFNTDLVAVKVVYRAGGAVRLSDAMSYLVSGNT